MDPTYFGAQRPRVLTHGLTDAENEALRPIVGSLVRTDDPDTVHAEEHDVLITTDCEVHHYALDFPRRIGFAPSPADWAPQIPPARVSRNVFEQGEHVDARFAWLQKQPAHAIRTTSNASDLGLASLVKRSCIPSQGETFVGIRPEFWIGESASLAEEVLSAPLRLAALVEEKQDDAVAWSLFWLPDAARSHLLEWVRAAFDRWRSADADAFPENAEWMTAQAWSSPAELSAKVALDAFESVEAARMERIRLEREMLTANIETARAEGDGWRALLTTSGDDLVQAVRESLEALGFTVIDADSLPQHKGKKCEDLRVSDADWVALVEVKGYTRAARSNDLMQVGGAATAYAAETGATPDATWYIPNGYRGDNPGQRPDALEGREDDVHAFAENLDGCIIDTRDLFKLRQLVGVGSLQASQARILLKEARGRLRAPEAHADH